MKYVVLRVQVHFPHIQLRCGWLRVRDNLCFPWDYIYLLCSLNTSCLCRRAPVLTSIFYSSQLDHLREPNKILKKHVGIRFEQRLISMKLETSFIRVFFGCPFEVLLGVTCANMLLATQWPTKWAPHLQDLSAIEVFHVINGLMEKGTSSKFAVSTALMQATIGVRVCSDYAGDRHREVLNQTVSFFTYM